WNRVFSQNGYNRFDPFQIVSNRFVYSNRFIAHNFSQIHNSGSNFHSMSRDVTQIFKKGKFCFLTKSKCVLHKVTQIYKLGNFHVDHESKNPKKSVGTEFVIV